MAFKQYLKKYKKRIVLVAIIIVLMYIAKYFINYINLIEYGVGEGINSVSLNGENYSPTRTFVAIDEGKQIGYASNYGNRFYNIYKINGEKSNEWVVVRFSGDTGLDNWVCKNASVSTPTLSEFNATKIKIFSADERFTKKIINSTTDVNEILKILTNPSNEEDLTEPIGGKNYMIYFLSPKYPGIAFKARLFILNNGKYYFHFFDGKYIEVTNTFNKYIN